MDIWRLGLLIAALSASTAGFAWLMFGAPESPRVSLVLLVVVFVFGTLLTAWYDRELLTSAGVTSAARQTQETMSPRRR